MARIPVTKTPKVYVGGQFIRSESGRVFPIQKKATPKGDAALLGNIPQCTRKDLRNAVEAAAKAGPNWAQRTPYNRGQILYRLGEMLAVSYTHLRAHETRHDLVCRLLLEK